MATTRLEFTKQERDTSQAVKANAQQALAAAQAKLTTAQQRQNAAAKAFAESEQAAAEIRKKLGEIEVPAQGHALLASLERNIIAMRAAQADILDAGDAVADAEAAMKGARTGLEAATAQLTAAATAFDEATARAKRLAAWEADIGQPPLGSLPVDADKALKEAPHNETYTKARERVEADIPKELRDRAHERAQHERARVKALADAVATAEAKRAVPENAVHGAAGQARLKAQREFDAAEAALNDYVTRARERYDLARGLLNRIVTAPPLPPAESKRGVDPEVVTRGKSAVALEKVRDDARAKVDDKREELAAAQLDALTKAPTADPLQDPAVKRAAQAVAEAQKELDDAVTRLRKSMPEALEKARDDAKADRDAKQQAHKAAKRDHGDDSPEVQSAATALEQTEEKLAAATAALDERTKPRRDARNALAARETELNDAIEAAKARTPGDDPESDPNVKAAQAAVEKASNEVTKAERVTDLDIWEAAVPDASWRMLAELEAAEHLLTELAAVKPAELLNALKNKERALVTAQETAQARIRTIAALDAGVAERRARHERALGAAPARLLTAIRGDR